MPRGVDELPFPTDTASLWIFIREKKFSDAKDIQLTNQGKVVYVIRPNMEHCQRRGGMGPLSWLRGLEGGANNGVGGLEATVRMPTVQVLHRQMKQLWLLRC